MDMRDTTPGQAREQGRNAALAGREVWCNPHIGIDADAWFAGYREVPDDQRGTRPDLRTTPTTVRRKRTTAHEFGVSALGDKCLPGSTPLEERRTPRPWASEGAGL